MQDCSISSALAMEILQSCINPLIWWYKWCSDWHSLIIFTHEYHEIILDNVSMRFVCTFPSALHFPMYMERSMWDQKWGALSKINFFMQADITTHICISPVKRWPSSLMHIYTSSYPPSLIFFGRENLLGIWKCHVQLSMGGSMICEA